MANCTHMKSCELFPIFTQSQMLKVWQTKYCEDAYTTCRRFVLSSQGEPVPINLLPNGKQLSVPSKPRKP